MRNKNEACSIIQQRFDAFDAFLAEGGIAHCQHFIHQEDFGPDLRSNCEAEPDLHSGTVTLHRGINEILQPGETDDLATPHLATMYDLEHLDITPEARKRIRVEHYDAGHMMYTRQADLKQLKADVAAWLKKDA